VVRGTAVPPPAPSGASEAVPADLPG